jgi:hypothetical protein
MKLMVIMLLIGLAVIIINDICSIINERKRKDGE